MKGRERLGDDNLWKRDEKVRKRFKNVGGRDR